MKTRILYLVAVLMMVSTVEAKTSYENPNSKWDNRYDDAEPISFNERGVKFYIFLDGEMDFDIHANDYGTTTEYYYRGKRNKSRTSHTNRATKVVRDYRGRVIRVGRVFINYNYSGKISRVGSVSIRYNRNTMTNIGNMRLRYDRYGNVRHIGSVKHRYGNYYSNYYHNYYTDLYHDYFYNNYVFNYNDHFFNDDFYDEYEQFEEDEDYYYYRSKARVTKNSKGKTERKQKMIKRKKEKKLPNENLKKRKVRGSQPR